MPFAYYVTKHVAISQAAHGQMVLLTGAKSGNAVSGPCTHSNGLSVRPKSFPDAILPNGFGSKVQP